MSKSSPPTPIDENGLPVVHKLVRSLESARLETDKADVHRELADKALIFLHIPKSAGRTFAAILDKWFLSAVGTPKLGLYATGTIYGQFLGADKVDAVNHLATAPRNLRYLRGHLPFGVHQNLSLEPSYVTFLRNPVERALSHFAFGADRGGWGLDTPFARVVSGGGIVDNPMTRQLAGLADPAEPCTEETLEQAMENLAGFAFVGLAEQFDQSLQVFLSRFGLPSVIYLDRGRGKPVNFPDGLAEQVNDFVGLDQQLYHSIKVPRLTGKTRPELWVDSTVISVEPEPGQPIPFTGLDLIKSTLAERNFVLTEPLVDEADA